MSTSVSSVTSHFPDAENGFSTTTSGSVSSGATTVGLNSTGGYTNGEPVVLVIDPTDASLKQTFTGIIDTGGVQVTSVVWTAGTNTAHSAGATVVDYPTATHIAMMSKGIKVQHAQDGTHTAVTATSVATDTITEKTTNTGVTIDSLLIKDGYPKALAVDQLTTLSNPYKFSVYRSGAWTAQTTATKVTFDAEEFDTNNNFATGTYTVPVSGFYQFNAAIRIASVGGQEGDIYLYKNGSVFKSGFVIVGTSGTGGFGISCLVQLTAGDTIEIWQSLASATRTGGVGADATWFNGFLVSKT